MTTFVEFQAKSKDGGITTVVVPVENISAIERTLSIGVIIANGAAYSCTAGEALRLARLILEIK